MGLIATMSIYLELTKQFNLGRLRTIVSSGQAVVLLRLAIASKDGDWIVREDQEAIDHVIATLERYGARYRFGAPLDLRWLRKGWSSHLEFRRGDLRVRTDFVTRPPRVASEALADLWRGQEGRDPPFTGPAFLLPIKQTAREKDWPIVGELARLLPSVREQLSCSRSAIDLLELIRLHPDLAQDVTPYRPALAAAGAGLDALRMELERERFAAMDADAARLAGYVRAAETFRQHWPATERRLDGMALRAAHAVMVDSAERWLPTAPAATSS